MIQLKNISKIYTPSGGNPLVALDGINLAVHPGEIYGVIGKSGAGKSTLIHCVNLLERPEKGEVIIDGVDLMRLSPKALRQIRRKIGMVFQNFGLLNHRTVLENVGLPLEFIKCSKKEIYQQIYPLLDLVGLMDKQQAYPSQLSGGQKQRVAIARALVNKPDILLCDEMTSALDPETTRSILRLIESINQQLKLSVLLITHEMEVIKSIADRVAVIDKGRVVEETDIFNLFTHPKHPITQALIHHTLSSELPPVLMDKRSSQPFVNCLTLLRITFSGVVATEPLISEVVKTFSVHINILQAKLELIKLKPLGVMIVAIAGEQTIVAAAINFLEKRGLTLEVVGYVSNNDLAVS